MRYREKSPLPDKQKTKSDKKEKDDLAKSKDVQFLIQVSRSFLINLILVNLPFCFT